MKILTLNTHSLQEENYEQKLEWFLNFVVREQPDLIALQEVNQSAAAPLADLAKFVGMVPVPGCKIPVRSDNHAVRIACRLACAGIPCNWVWLPIKLGYGKYDEGVALFRLHGAITDVDILQISQCCDYRNWKTRKILGAKIDGRDDWFFTVHMGWWQDEEEPFSRQWAALDGCLSERKTQAPVWLLGDFNSPAEVRGEGYDLIRDSGWQDTWLLAEETRGGPTVEGVIDGWRDKLEPGSEASGMRIDHIWCSRTVPVLRSHVIFDGKNEPQVSDHFGILLETKGEDL